MAKPMTVKELLAKAGALKCPSGHSEEAAWNNLNTRLSGKADGDPADPGDIAEYERLKKVLKPKKSGLPWYGWTGILLAIALAAFALYKGLGAGEKASKAQTAAKVALDSAQLGAAAHRRLENEVIPVINNHGRVIFGDDTTAGLLSRTSALESTQTVHGRRLDGHDSMLTSYGQRIDTLSGGLQQLRQEAKSQHDAALRWRDSVLGRVSVLEKRPAERVVTREVVRGTAAARSTRTGRPTTTPATTTAVETVQVMPTPGPTVPVIVRNTLNQKARVAYESWNRTLGPSGLIVLNLPPGQIINLVVTNTRTGEGWVIPVNAGAQREVVIPPR